MNPNLNFCMTSKYFFWDTNLYNTYNIYHRNNFCQHVFLFCAALDIQSNESHFQMSQFVFCCHNLFFCDSHNFGAQRNFYMKYFFVDTTKLFVQQVTFFCATCTECQHKDNVKNVNKEKQMCKPFRKSESVMLFSAFWLDFLTLNKSNADTI